MELSFFKFYLEIERIDICFRLAIPTHLFKHGVKFCLFFLNPAL